MASIDSIKQQAEKIANVAKEKTAEFTEAANEWADKPRPGMDDAFDKSGEFAQGAVDKVADGFGAVYEALKNKAEEFTGKDADGDGQVGNTGQAQGEIKAGAQIAAETVAGAATAAAGFAKSAIDAIGKKVTEADTAEEAAVEPVAEADEDIETADEPAAETDAEA